MAHLENDLDRQIQELCLFRVKTLIILHSSNIIEVFREVLEDVAELQTWHEHDTQ